MKTEFFFSKKRKLSHIFHSFFCYTFYEYLGSENGILVNGCIYNCYIIVGNCKSTHLLNNFIYFLYILFVLIQSNVKKSVYVYIVPIFFGVKKIIIDSE